jgi:hypothetical protein
MSASDSLTSLSSAGPAPASPPVAARAARFVLRWLLRAVAAVVVMGVWIWCILAIYFSNLPGEKTRLAAASIHGAGFAAAFVFLPRRWRTAAIFLAASAAVLAWWLLIPASLDRDWMPEVAVLPAVAWDGGRVTIRNLRDFEYRTESDFTPRYYDRTYDLSKLATMDLVLSHWDDIEDVAHTLLSFGFEDGDHVVASVETRREKAEQQTALRGIFKQYELIYVLGSERDLLRLRTSFRREDVYLYPTALSREKLRTLFTDILHTVDELTRKPRFYNTLTHNCTTGMVPHFRRINPEARCDVDLLLNGHVDRRAYDRGGLDTTLGFEELKKRAHINQYLTEDLDPEAYSRRIRAWQKTER